MGMHCGSQIATKLSLKDFTLIMHTAVRLGDVVVTSDGHWYATLHVLSHNTIPYHPLVMFFPEPESNAGCEIVRCMNMWCLESRSIGTLNTVVL